jgi:uncharacterized phage infection (PIP) family protein YhgE
MNESLMLIALGFLLATLFGLISAQFIWRRAVTVTLRKMNSGETGAAEVPQEQAHDWQAELDALAARHQDEMAPLKAEIGNLKAEGARLAAANETLTREKAQISAESERLKSEVERLKTGVATLREEIENAAAETEKHAASIATAQRELSGLEQALSKEAKHYETARERLAALDTPPLPPMPAPAEAGLAPAPESEQKDEPQQALEPYTAAEQDTDARTLAEVKASLLAELDIPRDTATAASEDEDAPPLEDPRNAGPSLAERIRALEAGVAH